MNTIPEICRLPGYVFPEGRLAGDILPDKFLVRLKSEDYEGDAILENQYIPKNRKLKNGEVIRDLVVVSYDPEDGIHVAIGNYFKELKEAFFFKKNKRYFVRSQRFPHWERDWEEVFSNHAYRNRKLIPQGDHCHWFEFQGDRCRIPIYESLFVGLLKGPFQFYPDSFYGPVFFKSQDDNGKNQYERCPPRCLYKADQAEIPPPFYFKGELRLNQPAETKQVHMYVHGFPSPAKWHYGVLKHMIGVSHYEEKEGSSFWEAFSGKKVEQVASSLFVNCKTRGSSCDEGYCFHKRLFKDVHKWIRSHCRQYLNQAVTFFGQETTKKIRIWERRQSDDQSPSYKKSKFIEIACSQEVENTPMRIQMGGEEKERREILVLRGHCYDWDSAPEPTFHLFILTMYVGPLEGKSPREPFLKEVYAQLNQGNLSIKS